MAVTDPHPPGSTKLNPLPHQERVADKLDASNEGILAAHDMGTGKTFTAINASKKLKLPILAITPASLRGNFQKELDATDTDGATVMSYGQALKRINNPEFTALAKRSLVVFDEAHSMGHSDSQRSALSGIPGKKLLLTGTPVRNKPHEIAPLINAASPGSLPEGEKEFNEKFIETKEVPVGFWGRLRGVKPGVVHVPTHLKEFGDAVRGKVDFHQNVDRSNFPSFAESIIEVPMSKKQQAAYDYTIGKYPAMAYKVRHGIPPSKSEAKNMTAFFNGPRQISNHPGEFNNSATDDDGPKFKAAVDEIQKRIGKDKNFRGVTYSNYLEAGMSPMSRELDRRGIKHLLFNGEMGDAEKKKVVEAYNKGEAPVLLISSAGGEGLDLKGTKLMQIMEPHWNEEKINQVRARAIRYKSHSHLPEEERHVEIQRFHGVPYQGFWRSLTTGTPHGRGVDQYLYEMSKKKQELNQPFLDVLKREGGNKKAAEVDEDGDAFLWIEVKEAAMNTPLMAQLFRGDPKRRYDYTQEIKDLAMMRDAPKREAQAKEQERLQKAEQKGIDDAAKAEQKAKDDAVKMQQKAEEKERDRAIKAHEKQLALAMNLQIKAQEREEQRAFEHQQQQEERAFEVQMKKEEREAKQLEQEDARAQAEVDKAQLAVDAATDALHRLQTGQEPAVAAGEEPAAEPAKAEGKAAAFFAMKEAEWTSPANMAVHAQKHGDEFGGQENYISAEKHLSMMPPEDLKVLNQRCESPVENSQPRCSTAYHSESLGIVHVKDDRSQKTISLYRRSKPIFPMIMGKQSFDPISGNTSP